MEQIEYTTKGRRVCAGSQAPGAPTRPARGPGAAGPASVRPGQQAGPLRLLLSDRRPALFWSHCDVPAEQNTLDLEAAIRQRWLFRKTAHQKPGVATQGSSTRVRADAGHVPAARHCRCVAAPRPGRAQEGPLLGAGRGAGTPPLCSPACPGPPPRAVPLRPSPGAWRSARASRAEARAAGQPGPQWCHVPGPWC